MALEANANGASLLLVLSAPGGALGDLVGDGAEGDRVGVLDLA